MSMKQMRRFLAGAIAGMMVFGCVPAAPIAVQAETTTETVTELTVSFDQDYAVVNEPLTVTAAGGENVAYEWYVDGSKISNTTNSYTPAASDLEKWIEVKVTSDSKTASAKMYFSKLPVVYIDTEGGQAITSKEEYIDANLRIQGNETYNSETTKLYDGLTEIRGRGNSTWAQPKKPYRLKLDKKTDVFGMGKSKHWVLLANYMDESLMRNTYAYDLSGSMGMEQCSTVWVDVILNGAYVGNYQFCENIRVDDTRVDIFDWEGFCEDSGEIIGLAEFGDDEDKVEDLMAYMCEEDMSWITSGKVTFEGVTYNIADYPDIEIPDINGGYILELDEYYDEMSKFKTASGQPIMFKEPEFTYTNTEMMNFVQTYVQAFEDAVESEDYCSSYNGVSTHYSELYDFDALVDYWLICEIFFQEEMNKKSTYMYKDIDELMMMGPIWDMDWSSGGEGDTQYTNRWATLHFNANAQRYQWYKYLVKDPHFLMSVQERYWEIRYVQLQDMLDRFDGDVEYLKESGEADGDRWGFGQSYEYYANHFDTWMNNHVSWLDTQMDTEDSLFSSFYTPSSKLALSLTDTEGNDLNKDFAFKAAADYAVESGSSVNLTISGSGLSGTATVFVNSKVYTETTVGSMVTIPADVLTADAGEKNTIEVKVGSASNYVTLKEKASGSDTGVDKSELETVLTEASEKSESGHTSASWAPFAEAYKNAYTAALNPSATQEEVNEVLEALKTAMNALVEVKDPADASDDYDISKIKYSAGTQQDGEGIELAFDNNESTFWHSQYNPRPSWYGTEEAFAYYWVLFELEEAEVLDAVRYLPRGGNGDIASYRVEGSIDGENWIDLAEGNWTTGTQTWMSAEFEPTELQYVRLWGTATSSSGTGNRHISARELRLRTSDAVIEVEPTPTPEPEVSLEILVQPSDVSAAKGTNATVTLEAAGEGLTYTWYYKNPGNVKFYVSGSAYVDENTYSIPMYAWRDGQEVYCVVTDVNGDSVQSNTVTITMEKGFEITKQPSSVTVAAGETATVTVEAAGEGLTYTWYYKNPGSTKFYKSGTAYVNENIYSITMNKWRDGQQVYCVITDENGNSVQSNTARLSMAK